MKYGIWCRVSGGVTGTRESWMKSNGAVQLFNSLEEAAKQAKTLSDALNGNPHRTADFSYTAKTYSNYD